LENGVDVYVLIDRIIWLEARAEFDNGRIGEVLLLRMRVMEDEVGRTVRQLAAQPQNVETDRPACVGKPICVDLDGTLIHTDSLVEGLLSVLSGRQGIGKLRRLLTPSRAAFKQRIGALTDLAPDLLPYNVELIEFLRERKRAGRRIVLATAADERTARAIAEHLGLFDDVVASDGVRNLKGEAKASELVRRYGPKGFDYAGDSRSDLPIWRKADGIVIVNASPVVAREARSLGNVIAEIDNRHSFVLATIRAMRPHQWVKNLLVFVPLLTSRSFEDWPGLIGAVGMFASFCAAASAVYLLNDLIDLGADRRHPRKRYRPFASGALSLQFGVSLAIALMGLGIALALSVGAAPLLIAYMAISLGYSLALKQYPLLDAFTLAALYSLRIVAGGVASGHLVTLWLLAFSGFTFLSLALIKRVGEMVPVEKSGSQKAVPRRGYLPGDGSILQMFGIASAFASSVVLALFVNSTAAFQPYSSPELLWGLTPLILFWQLRLWLSTARGHMHDDPIIYASRDWVSWLVAASVVATILLASSGARLCWMFLCPS
jgi:4-hydroxybenzoate polyprenyltransferase/phosphoserine phosphatase